jgi:nicotinamidase-related amidase
MSKNVLLIIDPQNDFTEGGNLSVPGATKDYENMIEMLNSVGDKFDETHVSLDTHTENHIGHPKFWKQTNGSDIPNSIFELNIGSDDSITGNNILIGVPNVDQTTSITVVPRQENVDLLNYVKIYLKWFNTSANTHGQQCFIWFQHCIEKENGHKVADILKTKLDEMGSKVHYHIKGQNNLAEMYSIFKAERPVSTDDATKLADFIYSGGKNTIEGENSETYKGVIELKNLKTDLNTNLLNSLLGTKEAQNTVYICGEARTHCVKSSAIDLLEYVRGNGYDESKIVFIKNASSPIMGTPNDILRKMTGKNMSEEEFKADEDLTGFKGYESIFTSDYVMYGAKAMTTDEIIQSMMPSTTEPVKGGRKSRKARKSKKSKKSKKSRKSRR